MCFCQRLQTACEALADGLELELVAVAIQLAEDHRGFGRCIFRQVVASDFLAVSLVHNANVSVSNLTKALLALFGRVDGDRENQLLDCSCQASELDRYRLVITVASTGAVVAQVFNRTISRFLVVVENEAVVVQHLAIFANDEDRRIQIELGAIGNTWIPAQAHGDFCQARGLFRQGNVTAFTQTYCHVRNPFQKNG